MSTETPTLEPGMIDISQSRRPSLAKLVGVEIRKMTDTRAGLWLLIVIAAVTVLINTLFLIFSNDDLPFMAFLGFSAIPQGTLLPVLAILLVTQEWGQRTGLVTFSLVPHRSKILGAKLVAAIVFVLAAFLVAILVALVLTPIAGAAEPWEDFSGSFMAKATLALVIGAVWGYAFGLALLNSAFAIVAYFAVPMVVSIVTEIWTSMQERLLWFDLGTSSGQLVTVGSMDGKEWAQIATGALIWIGIPLVIGWIRVTRTEIK